MRREIAAEAGRMAGLAPGQIGDVVRRVDESPLPTLAALEDAGFAPDHVVLAASAISGLPPAPRLLLRQPQIPADLDAIGIRDAGGTPLGVVQGRLWVAFSDPEAARAAVFSDDVVVCLAVNSTLAEARARFRREHPLAAVAATVALTAISPAEVDAFRRRRPPTAPAPGTGDDLITAPVTTAAPPGAGSATPPAAGPTKTESADSERMRRAAQMGRLKRFRFERVLGQGGMATVYLAVDRERPDEPIAIKVLAPHLQDNTLAVGRFRREVRALMALRHRHIVPIIDGDAESDGGVLWLACRYLDGGSLRGLLNRTGALPTMAVLPMVAAVLEGVAHAHASGVIHRDLKPENVLLGHDGSVCIADFGVSVAVGDAPLTRAGARFGTPAYMSPEQAQGGDIDARTDLYAIGVMLHELLAGANPLVRSSAKETLQAVARGEALPLPPVVQVPATVRLLRDSLLAVARDARPPDAEAALRAIRPLLAHCPPVHEVVQRLLVDPRAFVDADDGDIDGETVDPDSTVAGDGLHDDETVDHLHPSTQDLQSVAAGFDDLHDAPTGTRPSGEALRAVVAEPHSAFGSAPGAKATMDVPMAATFIDEPDPLSLPTLPVPMPVVVRPEPTPSSTTTTPPGPPAQQRGLLTFIIIGTMFVIASIALMVWARS